MTVPTLFSVADPKTKFWKMICLWNFYLLKNTNNFLCWNEFDYFLFTYNQINHFGKENYWNIYLSDSCIFQSLMEMNENASATLLKAIQDKNNVE